MRLWALVPARGGSRRLPGKHLRPLAGRPLIDWTLAAARDSGVFDRVLLSSDDPALLARAELHGAEALPRPADLARGDSTSLDVVLHALEAAGGAEPAGLLLLQPTSPFRGAERIREAAARLEEEREELVSVGPCWKPAAWLRRERGGRLRPLRNADEIGLLNGAVYAILVDRLRRRVDLLPERPAALWMTREESIDVDDELDWALAETVAAKRGTEAE